jgi:signal transduction histidine kinase
MGPDATAVLISAAVTAGVGAAGSLALLSASARRPAAMALGAPLVMVVSLAAGFAAATRSMVVAEDDYRTVLFVLLAGAPVAILVGVILARRVRALEATEAAAAAARERDQQIEASRRETIQWLSHDLRTPLTGIRLLAEALQEDRGDVAARADRIVVEADRMAGMVDDITELSRLHGALAPDHQQVVAIDDVVSEAVAVVSPIAASAGVVVRAGELAGVDVCADPDRLVRALANLVRNAVQHTPARGIVVVSTGAGDPVTVTVTDECGGLEEADLARMFEPGWRGDSARGERGMGLGTTIAREILRAQGGEVTVANRADGRGCTATVAMPTRAASSAGAGP